MMTSQSRLKARRLRENCSKASFELGSSLVQEVIVKSKDDIRFIFKNGFEVRV